MAHEIQHRARSSPSRITAVEIVDEPLVALPTGAGELREDHLMVKRPEDVVRAIIEASHYMVLATADTTGHPWPSPVYFAHEGYTCFYWVSSPEAIHSRNVTTRSDVGIAIFDSTVPIGTGQGVYLRARAAEVNDDEREPGIEVFSRRSQAHGGVAWTAADVRGDAELRLYRALVDEHSILAKDGRPDHRNVVRLP
jgi:nitroimidazol reductase NimA-like FMN-containing flavoprotein (pyridoxamine 5'-phosphate oxidase superfamily)